MPWTFVFSLSCTFSRCDDGNFLCFRFTFVISLHVFKLLIRMFFFAISIQCVSSESRHKFKLSQILFYITTATSQFQYSSFLLKNSLKSSNLAGCQQEPVFFRVVLTWFKIYIAFSFRFHLATSLKFIASKFFLPRWNKSTGVCKTIQLTLSTKKSRREKNFWSQLKLN